MQEHQLHHTCSHLIRLVTHPQFRAGKYLVSNFSPIPHTVTNLRATLTFFFVNNNHLALITRRLLK